MKKQLLLGTAIGALMVIDPALAADLPVKAPVKAPVVAAYNWTGCYFGGNVGYSWGRTQGDVNVPNLDTIFSLTDLFPFSLHPKGVIGGGQIGCNWQNNVWVLGLETDFQGSAEKDTTNFSSFAFGEGFNQAIEAKIEWFGTARGRVGYLITPTLMLYGTGGLAYGKTTFTDNVVQNLFGGGITSATSLSGSKTRVGWTLGGGVEGALFNWNDWTWKVEYLYVNLGSQGGSGIDPIIGPYTWNAKFTDNVLRVGLNYRIPTPR